MATLSVRLDRLEARATPPPSERRVYGVIGGASNEDAEQFVRQQGYVLTDADLVVQIVPMARSDNGPVRVDEPVHWMWTPRDEWKAAA